MEIHSPLDEAVVLSATILNDMEVGNKTNHQILLKCRRLARLVDDTQWQEWLDLELHGYNPVPSGITFEKARAFYAHFGRQLDAEKLTGLVHPLNTLEQESETLKLELQACSVPTSIHASDAKTWLPDSASRAINEVLARQINIRSSINARHVVVGRVMSAAHSLTLKWYNELHYSNMAQTIFERRRFEVDRRLKDLCPKALEQFVVAYERLRAATDENWSQALLSCRRILKSFADVVFPAGPKPYLGKDGKSHDVTDDKYINRLRAFITDTVSNGSFGDAMVARLEYIAAPIEAINDQANKGVHATISRREADSAVLQTYFLLADLLEILPSASSVLHNEAAEDRLEPPDQTRNAN